MTNSAFFDSIGEIIFIISVMTQIIMFLMWRMGYNVPMVKILMVLSNTITLCSYFLNSDLIFNSDRSLNIIIGKLILINLMFFSIIFTITCLIQHSNQKVNSVLQPKKAQEKIYDFTPISTDMEFNFDMERNHHVNKNEDYIKTIGAELPNEEFQKLINTIFDTQNKRKESNNF